MPAKKAFDDRNVARMLDDLNDYHESSVGGVRMKVTFEPPPRGSKYQMFHLSVNGKKVLTKQFAPSAGSRRTHPFGGAGGVAEAVFRQAVQS